MATITWTQETINKLVGDLVETAQERIADGDLKGARTTINDLEELGRVLVGQQMDADEPLAVEAQYAGYVEGPHNP